MALSNMQVFNEYLMPVLAEIYPQMIDKFNAASNNTIQLQAASFDGDFYEQSFYTALFASQRRVDRYAANGAASTTDIAQSKMIDVKVAGGFGPIRYEPSQMTWLNKPTQEGITIAADQFAQALLADQLNTAIATTVAAIENVADLTNDVSGTGQVTQVAINNGLALMGDRSQAVAALVMTGQQYHTLIGEAITNSNNLFEIGGVAVRDGSAFGQGRPIVVTDSPALRTADPFQKVLGLQVGGSVIKDGGDIITNVETTNGNERIETTFQADYTYGVGVKGFAWDTANGGASPSDASLATGTNWDQVVTDIKDCAGVLIVGQE